METAKVVAQENVEDVLGLVPVHLKSFKETLLVTKCSSNKGFGGDWNILPRSNFGGGGQFCSPQSLTAATLNRWR
jgi:hypothetical protein